MGIFSARNGVIATVLVSALVYKFNTIQYGQIGTMKAMFGCVEPDKFALGYNWPRHFRSVTVQVSVFVVGFIALFGTLLPSAMIQ